MDLFFFLFQACGLKGKMEPCREETNSKVCLFCERKWLVEENLSWKQNLSQIICKNVIWFFDLDGVRKKTRI